MRRPRSRELMLTCLTGTLVSVGGGAAQAGEQFYRWAKTAGAAYYAGSYTSGNELNYFQTRSTWLLLDQVESIEAYAFDKQGRRLNDAALAIRVEPLTATGHGAQNAATTPSRGEIAAPSEPTQTVQHPRRTFAGTLEPGEGVIEHGAGGDAQSAGDAEPGSGDAGSNTASSSATKPSSAATFNAQIGLGLGKEWLRAAGGITDYSGAAAIGSTSISVSWQPADANWYVVTGGEAHYYDTATAQSAQNGQNLGQATSKFLRPTARATVFYDFSAAGGRAQGERVAFGIGVDYFRMPLLLINNTTNLSAAFADRMAVGPYFAAELGHPLSAQTTFGLTLGLLPLALNAGSKALSANGYGFFRQAISTTLYSELGLSLERSELEHQNDCPALATCHDTSTSTSRIVAFSIAVGAKI